MRDLRFVAVEDGVLVLASAEGEQFRVPVDAALRHAVSGRAAGSAHDRREAPPSPRDIQHQLRSGLSPEQVAEHYGVDLDRIEKYAPPVIAELARIVDLAKRVVLDPAPASAAEQSVTFGGAVEGTLRHAGADAVEWSSWKEPDGEWTIQVVWTAGSEYHDARWSFAQRIMHLESANNEALTLFSEDALATSGRPAAPQVQSASALLTFRGRGDSGASREEDPHEPPAPVTELAAVRAPRAPQEEAETESLLDQLAARRGERSDETLFDTPDVDAGHDAAPSSSGEEAPLGELRPFERAAPREEPKRPRSNGRANMPTWDEIVFGSKHPDDDH